MSRQIGKIVICNDIHDLFIVDLARNTDSIFISLSDYIGYCNLFFETREKINCFCGFFFHHRECNIDKYIYDQIQVQRKAQGNVRQSSFFLKSVKLTLTIKYSFRRSADLHLKYLRYEQSKAGMSDLHQKWVKLVQMGKTRDF